MIRRGPIDMNEASELVVVRAFTNVPDAHVAQSGARCGGTQCEPFARGRRWAADLACGRCAVGADPLHPPMPAVRRYGQSGERPG